MLNTVATAQTIAMTWTPQQTARVLIALDSRPPAKTPQLTKANSYRTVEATHKLKSQQKVARDKKAIKNG